MILTYIAHSCFHIKTKDNISIVIDPYKPGAFGGAISYKPVGVSADIVLITHEHADHNAVEEIKGKPEVVRKPGEWIIKGIPIFGIRTYHDKMQGKERGPNTVYILEADGIRIAHLGDLGHLIGETEKRQLGDIDVLLTPVGGVFTIGPEEAWEIAELISPKIIIPMHYKTPFTSFPLASVNEFTKGIDRVKIKDPEVEIALPTQREVWVLKPLR